MFLLETLVPACAETESDPNDQTELPESEIADQGEALAATEVRVTARTNRATVLPGDSVAITAELTAPATYALDVRAVVTDPGGVRYEVARWTGQFLRSGVPLPLSASFPVRASARVGFYALSFEVTPRGAFTQFRHNVALFSVATQLPAPPPSGTARGITVSGRHLVGGSGRIFTARGPELVTADLAQLRELDTIAATGANAIRMLLTLDTVNGMTPQTFDQLVGRAVANELVVWISLFTWDNSRNREIAPALGGGNLRQMSDYLVVWKRQWLKDLVKKYDGWIVVDAMQEFKSSIQPPEDPRAVREWVDAAKQHLRFFREQGFTQPLEIMSSFEGRDLHAIVANADEILGADTLVRNGTKQSLFGWQAYWGTDFYRHWQGGLLAGRPLTASEAVSLFVTTRKYPIMVGLDSVDIPGTESYGTLMPTCSGQQVGWLWWEWNELVSMSHGVTVRTSRDGFGGAAKASN